MTRILTTIVAAMLFAAALTTAAGAQERTIPQSSAFLQLKQAIERHYYTYDRDRILPLLNRAQALIRQDGANWYPYYYAGILHVQLGNIVRADDKAAAYRHYTLAREHLEVAHRKSTSAETTLWMSAVYGKLASLRTFKMIYYGARSKAFMEDAYAMSRGNPKFFMLAGVHVMHTPAIFGGGKKRARDFLQRALAFVEDWKEPDERVVGWAARPEIWAYLAQLEVLSRNGPAARRYASLALKLQPDFGFVIRDVLPQLEAMEKAS